jgi:membrane-associated protein
LTAVLDALAALPAPAVVGVVALILVFESGSLLGMALPGTTLLVALGIWTHAAPGTLVPAAAAAACGTIAGAHLAWWRGRVAGPAGSAAAGSGRRAAALAQVALLGARMVARGPASVVALLAVGHWAAAARPVLPRVLGGAGVPYRVAGPVLLVSGAAWATTLVLVGERLGAQLLTTLSWVPIAVVVALGLLLTRLSAPRPTTT